MSIRGYNHVHTSSSMYETKNSMMMMRRRMMMMMVGKDDDVCAQAHQTHTHTHLYLQKCSLCVQTLLLTCALQILRAIHTNMTCTGRKWPRTAFPPKLFCPQAVEKKQRSMSKLDRSVSIHCPGRVHCKLHEQANTYVLCVDWRWRCTVKPPINRCVCVRTR